MIKPIRPIRIEGNVAYIPLTQGYEAIIDADDMHLVDKWNWHSRASGCKVYAVRNNYMKTPKFIRMHRLIMRDPVGFEIDHIDGNGLNNSKSNLRLATRSQNMMNRCGVDGASSEMKGVSWHAARGMWRARIKIDQKEIHIGMFDTEAEAFAAYKRAAENLHGRYARF
jgi:hypothetical protein